MTVSRAAIVTKSIEGPVGVFDADIADVVVERDGPGVTVGKDGLGRISAVGTGRVLKSLSASVMRARILSMPSERAVAIMAALFSGVRTDIGAGVGFGNTLDGGVNAGCCLPGEGFGVLDGAAGVTVRGRVCVEESGAGVD